jgi:hypothetical protein
MGRFIIIINSYIMKNHIGLIDLTEKELKENNGGFLLWLAQAYFGVAVYYVVTDPEGVLRGMKKCLY